MSPAQMESGPAPHHTSRGRGHGAGGARPVQPSRLMLGQEGRRQLNGSPAPLPVRQEGDPTGLEYQGFGGGAGAAKGFPGGSVVKNPPSSAGDAGERV